MKYKVQKLGEQQSNLILTMAFLGGTPVPINHTFIPPFFPNPYNFPGLSNH